MFERIEQDWNRFWFQPQDTSTLALFRIAFGLVVTLWTLSLGPNLLSFFGPDGIMPEYPQGDPGSWGVLAVSNTHLFVVLVFIATLLGALALTVGLHTRTAAVVVYLGIHAFAQRNPLVGNSGDELIGNLTLFCVFAPSGMALSVDRLRAVPGRFWEFPVRAPWALRLIQIQLSLVYLSAVWQKVQGELWRNGTAVSFALRITDVHRFATPDFLTHSVVLSEILTFGTLALEAALGILIWNRAARPWVLSLGILMHLTIDFSILVGFFSFAMIVCYITFIPAETASLGIISARDWCIDNLRLSPRGPHSGSEVAPRLCKVLTGSAGSPSVRWLVRRVQPAAQAKMDGLSGASPTSAAWLSTVMQRLIKTLIRCSTPGADRAAGRRGLERMINASVVMDAETRNWIARPGHRDPRYRLGSGACETTIARDRSNLGRS